MIKLKYGHAFYDDASDDELFEVPVIGADIERAISVNDTYAEIIGVRLEELFELIIGRILSYGYYKIYQVE